MCSLNSSLDQSTRPQFIIGLKTQSRIIKITGKILIWGNAETITIVLIVATLILSINSFSQPKKKADKPYMFRFANSIDAYEHFKDEKNQRNFLKAIKNSEEKVYFQKLFFSGMAQLKKSLYWHGRVVTLNDQKLGVLQISEIKPHQLYWVNGKIVSIPDSTSDSNFLSTADKLENILSKKVAATYEPFFNLFRFAHAEVPSVFKPGIGLITVFSRLLDKSADQEAPKKSRSYVYDTRAFFGNMGVPEVQCQANGDVSANANVSYDSFYRNKHKFAIVKPADEHRVYISNESGKTMAVDLVLTESEGNALFIYSTNYDGEPIVQSVHECETVKTNCKERKWGQTNINDLNTILVFLHFEPMKDIDIDCGNVEVLSTKELVKCSDHKKAIAAAENNIKSRIGYIYDQGAMMASISDACRNPVYREKLASKNINMIPAAAKKQEQTK